MSAFGFLHFCHYVATMGASCRREASEIDKQSLITGRNTEEKKDDALDQKETIEAVGHVKGDKGSNSFNEGTRKHEPVPTPSMMEINAAMDNLYMYTNTGDDGGEKVADEVFPALPTIADDVSNLHLKLANPFGASGLSMNPQDPSTLNNEDPRSTVLHHAAPQRLHLEEGASAQQNDTKTVFAPRQIIGSPLTLLRGLYTVVLCPRSILGEFVE